MAKPNVIVFARVPAYGTVKTRLARDIGRVEALRFYRHTLLSLVRRLHLSGRFRVVVALTPDAGVRARLPVWSRGLHIIAQGHGDLGVRMMRAMKTVGGPCVVIGSDIPEIRAHHVLRAFKLMGRAKVVFGPAVDGGYWLIGARHPKTLRLDALAGVQWSSAHSLTQSRARFEMTAVTDDVLQDVDDVQAYRRASILGKHPA